MDFQSRIGARRPGSEGLVARYGPGRRPEAGRQPLNSTQQAQFIAACERTAGGAIDCECMLNRLEADGYNSVNSLNSLVQQANSERFFGQSGIARTELTADALACRQ